MDARGLTGSPAPGRSPSSLLKLTRTHSPSLARTTSGRGRSRRSLEVVPERAAPVADGDLVGLERVDHAVRVALAPAVVGDVDVDRGDVVGAVGAGGVAGGDGGLRGRGRGYRGVRGALGRGDAQDQRAAGQPHEGDAAGGVVADGPPRAGRRRRRPAAARPPARRARSAAPARRPGLRSGWRLPDAGEQRPHLAAGDDGDGVRGGGEQDADQRRGGGVRCARRAGEPRRPRRAPRGRRGRRAAARACRRAASRAPRTCRRRGGRRARRAPRGRAAGRRRRRRRAPRPARRRSRPGLRAGACASSVCSSVSLSWCGWRSSGPGAAVARGCSGAGTTLPGDRQQIANRGRVGGAGPARGERPTRVRVGRSSARLWGGALPSAVTPWVRRWCGRSRSSWRAAHPGCHGWRWRRPSG